MLAGAVLAVKWYGKLATVTVGYAGDGTERSYGCGTDVAPGVVLGVVSSDESSCDVCVNAVCIVE